MVQMVKRIINFWEARRRRRAFAAVRREFRKSGVGLDGVSNAELEDEIHRSGQTVEDAALGAKAIYLMARRLAPEKEGSKGRASHGRTI